MRTKNMRALRGIRARLGGEVFAPAMLILAMLTLGVVAPAIGLAQDEDPGESRSAAFVAAEGAQAEDVPGGALMVAAYGVVWVLVLGYVVSIGFRQSSTSRNLELLRQDLAVAAKNAEREA